MQKQAEGGRAEFVAFVSSTRQKIASGKHREALLKLLSLASSSPSLAEALEDLILTALLGTAEGLAQQARHADARYLFAGARRVLPHSCHLGLAEGGFLHRHGEHLAAIRSFERVLEMDTANPAASESLESLRSFAAERWHFRMLNDKVRNSSYDAAIRRAVSALLLEQQQQQQQQGQNLEPSERAAAAAPLVLDIGCGTGILSLMAARAGCARAWGVEVNTLMAEVGKETVARHASLAPAVSILNAHSSSLVTSHPPPSSSSSSSSKVAVTGVVISGPGSGGGKEGGKEGAHPSSPPSLVVLPRPVDLVVTELVDSGLVGEHMIAVLRHAASGSATPRSDLKTEREEEKRQREQRSGGVVETCREPERTTEEGPSPPAQLSTDPPPHGSKSSPKSSAAVSAATALPGEDPIAETAAVMRSSTTISDDTAPDDTPAVPTLLRRGGRVIPAGATLFALPIEAPQLRPRQRVMCDREFDETFPSSSSPLSDRQKQQQQQQQQWQGQGRPPLSSAPPPPALAAAAAPPPAPAPSLAVPSVPPPLLHGLRFCSLRGGRGGRRVHSTVLTVCLDEAYTCEALDSFPHRPLAAQPIHALDLDFTDLAAAAPSASSAAAAYDANASFLLRSEKRVDTIKAPASASLRGGGGGGGGVVDAIAVWFDLILDRGNGRDQAPISFSTRPGRVDCGWDQGLYRLANTSNQLIGEDEEEDGDVSAGAGAAGVGRRRTEKGRRRCKKCSGLVVMVGKEEAKTPAAAAAAAKISDVPDVTESGEDGDGGEGDKCAGGGPGVILETTLRCDDTLSFRLKGPSVVTRCLPGCPREADGDANDDEDNDSDDSDDDDDDDDDDGNGDGFKSKKARGDGGGGGGRGEKRGLLALGEMDLAHLNDRPTHNAFCKALRRAVSDVSMAGRLKEGALSTSSSSCRVLELCGAGFSLVGLCAASLPDKDDKGDNEDGDEDDGGSRERSVSKRRRGGGMADVTIRAGSEAHGKVLEALAAENDLLGHDEHGDGETLESESSPRRHKVRLLPSTATAAAAASAAAPASASGDDNNGNSAAAAGRDIDVDIAGGGEAVVVVVVADVVEGCGLLRQGALEELQDLMTATLPTTPTAMTPATAAAVTAAAPQRRSRPLYEVIPRRIALTVVPIECSALRNQNEVRPDASPGLDLSALNSLGVRLFRELDLASLPHALLAPPAACPQVLDLNENPTSASSSSVPPSSCRLSVPSQLVRFAVTRAGTVHAFAFWWRLTLHEGDNFRASGEEEEEEEGNEEEEGGSGNGSDGASTGCWRRKDIVIDTGPGDGSGTPRLGVDDHHSGHGNGGGGVGGNKSVPGEVGASASGRHWRQAAVAVRPPRCVKEGDELVVAVSMGIGVSGGVDIRLLGI